MKPPCLITMIALTLSVSVAMAAQDAMVTVDQANVRERPSLDSKVIEGLPTGKKVRISNKNKDGWFKIKAGTGQFGWIWQGDIAALGLHTSDVKAANLELRDFKFEEHGTRREPYLHLRMGGLLFGLIPGDLNTRLGVTAGRFHPATGFLLQGGYRLNPGLWLALRYAQFAHAGEITSNGARYSIRHEGNPVLVGLDKDISQGELVDIGTALYLGWSFSNRLEIAAGGQPPPNGFSVEDGSFAILLDLSSRVYIKRWLSLVFEAGLYYSTISSVTVPAAFNGDNPFREGGTGQLVSIKVNHIGPLVSASLQFNY